MSNHVSEALFKKRTSWPLIEGWCSKRRIHPDELCEEGFFDSLMRLLEKLAFIVSISAIPALLYLLNKAPLPEGLVWTLVASSCAWIFSRFMLYNSPQTALWNEHLNDVSNLNDLIPGCVRLGIGELIREAEVLVRELAYECADMECLRVFCPSDPLPAEMERLVYACDILDDFGLLAENTTVKDLLVEARRRVMEEAKTPICADRTDNSPDHDPDQSVSPETRNIRFNI